MGPRGDGDGGTVKLESITAPHRPLSRADLIPFALLVVIVVALAQLPPNDDAAWQLWIGRSLAQGAELYRDIIEINPPLWFWTAVPIVKAAAVLHVSGSVAQIGFFGVSAGVSLLLVYALLEEHRARVGCAMLLAFFLSGLSATGQREQFTLVAVTPYVLLCGRRASGREVPPWLALAIGVWASFGLALKPFFALVPLTLEAWLTSRRGLKVTPEFAAILMLGAAYVLATVAIYPAYFTFVVPFTRAHYGAFDVPLAGILLSEPVLIVLLGGLGFALLDRSDELTALALAAATFLLCFAVQGKGWRYHGLPAIGMVVMLALLGLRQRKAIIPLGLALLLTLVTTDDQAVTAYPATMAATRDIPPGSSILVLSHYANPAWPMVELRDLRWTSPFMFLWMYQDRRLMLAIARKDLRRRPDHVLVDSRLELLSDAGVRSALSTYARGQRYGRFDRFDRIR